MSLESVDDEPYDMIAGLEENTEADQNPAEGVYTGQPCAFFMVDGLPRIQLGLR